MSRKRGGEELVVVPLDYRKISANEEDIQKTLASFPHQRIREGDYGPIVVPKMQAAKQSFVDLPDQQRIAIQTWGNEDASVKVMALHGWMDNSNTWNTFIPLLLSRSPCPLHIVAVDFAGHGLSTHRPPSSFYQNIQYALDSFSVATELGWEKFILMGHSMGGIVSTIMASLLPDRIIRCISVDTCGPFVNIRGRNYGEGLAYDFERAPQLIGRQPRVYGSFEALFDRYVKNNSNLKENSARIILSRGVERVRIDDEVSEDQQQPEPEDAQPTEKSGSGQFGYCFRHDPRIVGGKMEVYTEEMIASLFLRMSKPIMFIMANRKSRRQSSAAFHLVQQRVRYLRNCESKVVVVDGEHHVHLCNPERIIDSVVDFLFPKKSKL